MKKFILFLLSNFCLIIGINMCYGQWKTQNSGTTENLYSVCFPTDVTYGWVVGGDDIGNSVILNTTNGGKNWTIQHQDTTGSLYSVSFNGSNGVAVGWAGTIITTTDGGKNWSNQSNTITANLNSVCFISNTKAFIVGDNGSFFNTTDGGKSWNQQSLGTKIKHNLGAIRFSTDLKAGYIVGDSGTILYSSNQGGSWSLQTSNTPYYLCSVSNIFNPSGNSYYTIVIGNYKNNGIVLQTDNSGTNWFIADVGITVPINSTYFILPSMGFIVGGNGTILKTINSGDSWSNQSNSSVTTVNLNSIIFPGGSEYYGYIVGDNGIILKTTDGGQGINEYDSETLKIKSEIYPNPVNNNTVISYHLPVKCFVIIKIYNLLGKEIMILTNEEKDKGDYSVRFNSENLQNGIYFYEIKAGGNIISNKIVINK